MKFPPFINKIKLYLSIALIGLIRYFPYAFVLPLFKSLGIVVWLLDPFHRKVAAVQMQAALGIKDTRLLVMKIFMNQAEIFVDTVKYVYMSDEELRSRIVIKGKENLDEALASGRGLMMITGHIGNWEILGNIPRVLGTQFCIMADIRNDPQVEAIISEIRSRCGCTILPPTGTFHMLVNELKSGKTIGMVIDMRGEKKEDIYCDVFGIPAPTKTAPASIAIQANALVMPVHIIKRNGTYYWNFAKAMDAADFGSGGEGVRRLSEFMQNWVASVIREHPDHWFWLYSRWLKRSELRTIIKKKLDFKEFVLRKARERAATP